MAGCLLGRLVQKGGGFEELGCSGWAILLHCHCDEIIKRRGSGSPRLWFPSGMELEIHRKG